MSETVSPGAGPDGTPLSVRILYTTDWLRMGGVEMNLVRLVREFGDRGHQMVVASQGGLLEPELLATGARHVELCVSVAHPRSVAADIRTLAELVDKERPDVIHIFSPKTALLMSAVRLPSRVTPNRRRRFPPTLSSVMGLVNTPEDPALLPMSRCYALSLGADKVIVPSPAIAKVMSRLPVRGRRLVSKAVLGVPVGPRPSAEERAALRAEIGLGPDQPVVMTIGRLDASKGHHLFLEAAAHVSGRQEDARFVIIGDGALRDELEETARRLGIRSRTLFLGEVADAARLVSVADVCVRPGIIEGLMGITVLEAQVMGVPVVGFETEDIKLAVTDRQTGLLVPPCDTRALGAAILELLENPQLAASLAHAGRTHVEQHHAIEVIVDGLEALYRDEIAACSGRRWQAPAT